MTKSRHANLREGWAAGHVQLSDVVKVQAEAAGIDLPAPRLYAWWILPRYRRWWAWWWRMQARIWAAEAEVPYDRILLSYADRRAILDGLGLHDDGRNYSLLLRNTGEIVWGHFGAYVPAVHDAALRKVVREEREEAEELLRLEAEAAERLARAKQPPADRLAARPAEAAPDLPTDSEEAQPAKKY